MRQSSRYYEHELHGTLAIRGVHDEMMREEEISRSTHHFTLLKLGNILLKDEFALSFNLGLLPDGMLSEEFVSGSECRVVKHVGVALQHVPNGRTEFRQTSLSLLLLLRPKAVDILRLIQHSSHASCSSQSAPSAMQPSSRPGY